MGWTEKPSESGVLGVQHCSRAKVRAPTGPSRLVAPIISGPSAAAAHVRARCQILDSVAARRAHFSPPARRAARSVVIKNVDVGSIKKIISLLNAGTTLSNSLRVSQPFPFIPDLGREGRWKMSGFGSLSSYRPQILAE